MGLSGLRVLDGLYRLDGRHRLDDLYRLDSASSVIVLTIHSIILPHAPRAIYGCKRCQLSLLLLERMFRTQFCRD